MIGGSTIFGNSSIQQALKNVDVDINMKGHRITNVGTPINSNDVATKSYVLAAGGSGLSEIVSLNELNNALPLSGNLSFVNTANPNNYRVLVENPTANTHASNKQYVDQSVLTETTRAINAETELQDEITLIGNRSLQGILDTNGSSLSFIGSGHKLYVDISENETDQNVAANLQYVDESYNLIQGQLAQRSLDTIQQQLGLFSDLDFSTETTNKILACDVDMNTHKLTLRSLESPADPIGQMEPTPWYLTESITNALDQRITDQNTDIVQQISDLSLNAIHTNTPADLQMGISSLVLREDQTVIEPQTHEAVSKIWTQLQLSNLNDSVQTRLDDKMPVDTQLQDIPLSSNFNMGNQSLLTTGDVYAILGDFATVTASQAIIPDCRASTEIDDNYITQNQINELSLQYINDVNPNNLDMQSRQILVDNVAEGISPDPRQVVPAEYIDDAIGSLQSQLNNQTLNTIYQYNKTGLDMSLDTEYRILLRSNQNNETIENIPSTLEPVSYGYIMQFISNLGNLIQTNAETSLSGDQQLQANIDELQNKLNYVPPVVEGEPELPVLKMLATQNNLSIYDTLDMNSNLISFVADPIDDQDVATKNYVDTEIVAAQLPIQDSIDLRALISDLDQEILDRQDADTTLQTNIDLKANQTALQDEIDTRTTQDGQLLTNINTRALQSDLSAEISTRLNNDNQLQANIDNKRDILTSYSITETNTAINSYIPSKIQNSAVKSKIDCSQDNQIELFSNNTKIGDIKQAVGQTGFTPLLIQSVDKLQFQSPSSSISAYGSKQIDTNIANLNTHGLYVSGIDNSSANVQAVVNIGVANSAQLYATAGHLFNGTKYSGIFSDSQLTLASSLNPQSIDSQINLYTSTQSQALQIQCSQKAGYASTTNIDQPNQFTSKAYVDNLHNTQAQSLANMYTISDIDLRFDERDTAIATKLNASVIADYSTTVEMQTALDLKADISSVDESISTLQDSIDLKANSSQVYSITEVNDLLLDKLNNASSLASIQFNYPIEATVSLNDQTFSTTKNTFESNELVTKQFVLDNAGSSSLPLNEIQNVNPCTDNINLNDIAILSNPLVLGDEMLVNKSYVDTTINSFSKISVGSIIIWYSASIPSGWLLCNGQSINSTLYPDLIALIGNNVPDLRGYFLRGLDTRTTGNVDPTINRTIGSIQTSDNLSHMHTYQDVAFMNGGGNPNWTNTTGSGNSDGDNDPMLRQTTTNGLTYDFNSPSTQIPTTNSGGTESRPINKAVNFIICASISSSGSAGVSITSNDNLNMNNFQIKSLNDGTLSSDAINLGQLNSAISTINTSLSSKYNSTVQLNNITLANGNLSLNANKIVDLSDPTSNFDAVNLFYLNNQGFYNSSSSIPKLQFNATSMQALMPTSTTFQVKFYNNSLPYIECSNGSKSVNFNADLFQLYNNTTGTQIKKITNDGMWFNRAINLRSSLSQGGDAVMYLNVDGFPQTKDYGFHLIDSSGGGAVFDSRCTFNGTIEANSSTYINGLSYFSDPTRTDIIGSPISCGQIAGYSIICDGSISSTDFNVYVPISDRRSKTNIDYTVQDLSQLRFCYFKYCPNKLQQLTYKDTQKINCNKLNFGVIQDEVPERYRLEIPKDKFDDKTEQYYTVDIDKLKNDALAYLMERNRELEIRLQRLEQLLSQ